MNKNTKFLDANVARNSCARQSQIEEIWEEDLKNKAREKIRRLETQLTEQLKTVVQNSNRIFRM
jgi:hypothetical protein